VSTFEVRALRSAERRWLAEHLELAWGSTTIVSRGREHDVSALPALVATSGEELVGLATYELDGDGCQIVTLEAFRRQAGIGSALLAAVADHARSHGCRRVWLVTTNDNLDALRFYQRRGMRLTAVHARAVDASRALKPEIPRTGDHGIPISDELELELQLR
jgi:ribosomal protein S18 acetylase RimI-like enzyme